MQYLIWEQQDLSKDPKREKTEDVRASWAIRTAVNFSVRHPWDDDTRAAALKGQKLANESGIYQGPRGASEGHRLDPWRREKYSC